MGTENRGDEQFQSFENYNFGWNPPIDTPAAAEHNLSSISVFDYAWTPSLSVPPLQSDQLQPYPDPVPVPPLPLPSPLGKPVFDEGGYYNIHQEDDISVGIEQNPVARESDAKRKFEAIPNSNGPSKAPRTQDDLEPHLGKSTLNEAASSLKISRSTLKRRARKNGISRWPSNNLGVDSSVPRNPNSDQNASTPKKENMKGDVRMVKMKYDNDFIKFELFSLSKVADLHGKVLQRLKLDAGSYEIKYLDEEKDWILLACDEDLEICTRPSGETEIRMLLLPVTTGFA